MNVATLRDVRLRALTLGELPWTDDFVRFCEDVEDAVAASDGDTVASLTETIGKLRESLERETESATEATRELDQERDKHAETRQELTRVANRCAELEAKLPQDVQELRAALVELREREAFARRELTERVMRNRDLRAALKKACGMLTPKARERFIQTREAECYVDAMMLDGETRP